MDLPKVAFAPASRDACALYRMFIPHLHTPGSKYIFTEGEFPIRAYQGVHVVVIQRQHTAGNMKAIQLLKKLGCKIIYDLDDDLWNVPKENPGRARIKQFQQWFGVCAKMCDAMMVSTVPLKLVALNQLKPLPTGYKIHVVPNAIDFNLFRPVPAIARDYVTVGWAGTNTHIADVRPVFQILPELLKANKDIRFKIVGLPVPELLKSFDNVSSTDFVPVGEYASRLPSWRFDIMLAPLEDNQFNKSKSNIKILEAAAIGVPILVSDVAPYKDFCRHDDRLAYLVCRTKQQWHTKIEELAADVNLRNYYARIMRNVAETYFDASVVNSAWHRVFADLA